MMSRLVRTTLCGVLVAGTLGFAPAPAAPADPEARLVAPEASSTIVRIDGRAYRVSAWVIQMLPDALPAPARPAASVRVSITPVDGGAIPARLATPEITLTFARRSLRPQLQPDVQTQIFPQTSASYSAQFGSIWRAGTRVQAKINLRIGNQRATVRFERLFINVASPLA